MRIYMHTSGTAYIIAAASGTGKTSLAKALTTSINNIITSISHTTRPIRPGEKHGVDYFFVDRTVFETMIANDEFIEYAEVFGHYYGTSRKFIDQQLQLGIDVMLDIDWQGAQQIRQHVTQCISIFLLPPSKAALRQRLENRKRDTDDVIQHRLEMASDEISHYREFDYLIINDNFNIALENLIAIVQSQRLTRQNQEVRYVNLLQDLIDKNQ